MGQKQGRVHFQDEIVIGIQTGLRKSAELGGFDMGVQVEPIECLEI